MRNLNDALQLTPPPIPHPHSFNIVPVATGFSQFLSMRLVLISILFITSLSQFIRGVCSPPTDIGDPMGLEMYTTIDPPQFDRSQSYVGLHPVLDTQGRSPPKVLRGPKFLGVSDPPNAGNENMSMSNSIFLPLHPKPSIPPAEPLPSTPPPTPGPSNTLADNNSTSIPATLSETKYTSSFPDTSGFPTPFPIIDMITFTKTSSGLEETSPPVTSTPNRIDEKPNENPRLKVGAIAAGILSGLILVFLFGAYIYISRRDRRGRPGKWTSSHHTYTPGPVKRRARSDVWGRRQRIVPYPRRSPAENWTGGDPSASDVEEGMLNLRNQITLINARIQQLETQERAHQDIVINPVSRPPTYRSSPSQYSRSPSLDTTPFVMHKTSLPVVEIDPIKT